MHPTDVDMVQFGEHLRDCVPCRKKLARIMYEEQVQNPLAKIDRTGSRMLCETCCKWCWPDDMFTDENGQVLGLCLDCYNYVVEGM